MSKIYISGKISGLNEFEAKHSFRMAMHHIAEIYYFPHRDIVNPMDLKPLLGIKNWWCYMAVDLYHLRKCDAIFMLSNWKSSRGACIEHLVAVWMNKKIIYQKD